MKKVKTLALISMIISSLGLFGSFVLMGSDGGSGLLGVIIYGFYLWFSVEVRALKESKRRRK